MGPIIGRELTNFSYKGAILNGVPVHVLVNQFMLDTFESLWPHEQMPDQWIIFLNSVSDDDLQFGMWQVLNTRASEFAPKLPVFMRLCRINGMQESFERVLKNRAKTDIDIFLSRKIGNKIRVSREIDAKSTFQNEYIAAKIRKEYGGLPTCKVIAIADHSVVSERDKTCTENVGEKHRFSERIAGIVADRRNKSAV